MNAEGQGATSFEMEPDAEFLARLEWQVRTEARRESRFGRPVPALGWRRLRAAAVLALTLVVGAGCVFAAQRLQQSRESELRAAQWKVRCDLGQARLRSAKVECEEARARFEAGVTSEEEFAAADCERRRLEHESARLDDEAAEVAQTGREPSDRISAPLVGGRDFARERLEIAAAGTRDELQAAEQRRQVAEQRHAAGVATDAEVGEATQRLKQARNQQRRVEQRIALRTAFLDGRTSPLQAELEDLRLGAESAAVDQRDALEAAQAELAQVRALVDAGSVSQHELRTALRRVAESEAARRLGELELDVLAREAAPGSGESKR